MSHTPTPWKIIDTNNFDAAGNRMHMTNDYEIVDANNENVIKPSECIDMDIEVAEFIVRAVNSHEALLEALKIATEYVKSDWKGTSTGKELIPKLEKAIAQAEGKSS